MQHIGIDVGKRGLQVCMKDQGIILEELSLSNDSFGANKIIDAVGGLPARAVIEATGNHWIRLYDALSEHGIATKLANPIRTRMIAEARIKNDRLDARVLADLLRGDLVAESYVPTKQEREWRALVRHRASLVRTSADVKNRVQALLDKYELRSEFSDLFGKRGMEWLSSLKLDAVDQAILESDLKLLKSLEEQVESITSLAKESDEVSFS
jgi:transposase